VGGKTSIRGDSGHRRGSETLLFRGQVISLKKKKGGGGGKKRNPGQKASLTKLPTPHPQREVPLM